MQVRTVGIAWYRPEDYLSLKAMLRDSEVLPDTYRDWLKNATALYVQLTREGLTVVKAYIDPEEFPEWCNAKEMHMDTRARTLYANECAMKHESSNHQFNADAQDPRSPGP